MLPAFVYENELDWDQGLCYVLFSYRELPIEELGFSPFELTFGKDVKGSLAAIYTTWWEAGENKASCHVVKYLLKQKKFLEDAMNVVVKQCKNLQNKDKEWYDKKAREVEYIEGDLVLVLQTQPGKPLSLKYTGPYTILKKVSPVNYLIAFKSKRKPERVVHINLLCRYVERQEFLNVIDDVIRDNNVAQCDNEVNESFGLLSVEKQMKNELIAKKMAHLNEEQKCQLKNVLDKYSNVISDTPGCVSHVTHKIVSKPNVAPVSQHPYRMSPEYQAKLRKEVDELLKLDMIEPSHSEWSSPAIFVPKPDGSIRCVIDYRKVNNLIEGNSFPIPRNDDLIDRIGKVKFLTKMDLSKGFYQIPLDENSKFITTFCTPFGSYN